MNPTRRATPIDALPISRRWASRSSCAALICLLLCACATTGDPGAENAPPERPEHQLKVANARVEAEPGSAFATAYFVVVSQAPEARTIVGASGACCSSIRLSRAVLREGRMASEILPEMEIPAGGAVAFVPRGLSLELDLNAPLAPGESVVLDLEFANAKPLTFEAKVDLGD